ncbi:MAG: hypothetical protein ACREIC_10720, partial [Limisphaerales bacterium]
SRSLSLKSFRTTFTRSSDSSPCTIGLAMRALGAGAALLCFHGSFGIAPDNDLTPSANRLKVLRAGAGGAADVRPDSAVVASGLEASARCARTVGLGVGAGSAGMGEIPAVTGTTFCAWGGVSIKVLSDSRIGVGGTNEIFAGSVVARNGFFFEPNSGRGRFRIRW